MSHRMAFFLLIASCSCSCRAADGDLPEDAATPTPLGTGSTLRALQDPHSEQRLVADPPARCGRPFSAPLRVSGVVVNWVDRYDETADGTSTGTLWVQDYDSVQPWSGTSLYAASFVPSTLNLDAGDTVDFHGTYQETVCLGGADFQQRGGSAVLPQVASPTVSLRFDGPAPTPVEIPLSDLESFETGRRWIGMLVTVRDLNVVRFERDRGRVGVRLSTSDSAPALSNEFRPLDQRDFPKGRRMVSATGVVTWFLNFKIATRIAEDVIFAP